MEKTLSDDTIGYLFLAIVLIGLGVFLYFQNRDPDERWTGPIDPLPELGSLELDMDKALLGRRLYHDGILSADGSLSCATCHAVDEGGAEPRVTSTGIGGAIGPINAPTTLNTWNHIAQFWDGRAADLEEQALGPIENPIEMGAQLSVITERLNNDEYYAAQFGELYDDGVTEANLAHAIAEYERSLITPGPFDAWLAGDDEAISAEAVDGYRLFVDTGCTTCHTGPGLGGESFQKLGLINNYFERRGGEITEADQGRFNATGNEADRHFFKVPTLRNVAMTAPYFHDGHEWDLGEAVRTMAHVQLNKDLTDEEVASMVSFLETLDGELPAHAIPGADELPPERSYEVPLPYDLRFVKRVVTPATFDENGQMLTEAEAQLFVEGKVPNEEVRAFIQERTALKFPNANFDGLTIDASIPMEANENFGVCLDKSLDALNVLSQGRADFDFAEASATKFSFVGEGDAESMAAAGQIMSTIPEGFEWSEPLKIYDGSAADACDGRLTQVQQNARIEFETGSARLNAASRQMLENMPAILDGCPENVRVLVAGHTDNEGDAGLNLRLSRQRARSVFDTLVRAGVDPSDLVSQGYGETKPIADNSTEEGRAQNRRIDIALMRDF